MKDESVQNTLDRMSLHECIKRNSDKGDWFDLNLLSRERRATLAKEYATKVQENDKSDPFAWLRAYNRFMNTTLIDAMDYEEKKHDYD